MLPSRAEGQVRTKYSMWLGLSCVWFTHFFFPFINFSVTFF